MQVSSLNNMAVNPLSNEVGAKNITFDSASASADAAKFESLLKETVRKANVKAEPAADEEAMAKRDKELKEACKGFEAMFLSMMYKSMRSTVPENTLFGENSAQKIFQDMYDQKLMDNVADTNSVGIADMLYKQLSAKVLGEDKDKE